MSYASGNAGSQSFTSFDFNCIQLPGTLRHVDTFRALGLLRYLCNRMNFIVLSYSCHAAIPCSILRILNFWGLGFCYTPEGLVVFDLKFCSTYPDDFRSGWVVQVNGELLILQSSGFHRVNLTMPHSKFMYLTMSLLDARSIIMHALRFSLSGCDFTPA